MVVNRADCTAGSFYTAPTAGQTIDSLKPLEITWDIGCLSADASKVDIYVYAPKTSQPLLHEFHGTLSCSQLALVLTHVTCRR